MADVSISRPDLKGLLSLEKKVLAQRVLDLHDEFVRERARRDEDQSAFPRPRTMLVPELGAAEFHRRYVVDREGIVTPDASLPACGSFHG